MLEWRENQKEGEGERKERGLGYTQRNADEGDRWELVRSMHLDMVMDHRLFRRTLHSSFPVPVPLIEDEERGRGRGREK